MIPYVACWSSEEWNDVRPDPLLRGRIAIFSAGARGEGKPVLGKLHEERQREVVVKRLCQVCAKSYHSSAIAMGPHEMYRLPSERGFGPGRVGPLYTEPPTCLRCAAIALAHCPGLRRSREQLGEAFPIYHVRAFTMIAQMVGKNLPEELQRKVPKTGAVGYVKIALTRYGRTSIEEVLAAAERKGAA